MSTRFNWNMGAAVGTHVLISVLVFACAVEHDLGPAVGSHWAIRNFKGQCPNHLLVSLLAFKAVLSTSLAISSSYAPVISRNKAVAHSEPIKLQKFSKVHRTRYRYVKVAVGLRFRCVGLRIFMVLVHIFILKLVEIGLVVGDLLVSLLVLLAQIVLLEIHNSKFN